MAKVKGLYKRGHVWWIRYAGPDGKIRFESSKSSSFKGAQALLIERKKEVMEGKDPIPAKQLANYSFQELAEHYLPWAERQRSFHTSKKFVIPQLRKFFGVNSPYVFADGKGKRFQDVKKAFHSACKRAGIKDFRFHDLPAYLRQSLGHGQCRLTDARAARS